MTNLVASIASSWLRRMLLLAAVFGGSAQAAVYTGVWDPPYGFAFGGTATTGLGWRGTAEFFVPDTCVPSGTATVLNIPYLPGCGGAAAVHSAEVELYNVATSAHLATLVFDEDSLHIGALRYVGGALSWLLTSPSDYVNPTENLLSVGVSNSTEFSLFFDWNGPHLAFRDCGSSSTSTHWHPRCTYGVNTDTGVFHPTFTITRVPEPGTLALVCLALLALSPRRVRAMLSLRR